MNDIKNLKRITRDLGFATTLYVVLKESMYVTDERDTTCTEEMLTTSSKVLFNLFLSNLPLVYTRKTHTLDELIEYFFDCLKESLGSSIQDLLSNDMEEDGLKIAEKNAL